MRTREAAALAALALACGHRPPLRPPPAAEAAAPETRTATPAAAATPDHLGPSAAAPAPEDPHLEPDLLGAVHVVKRGETLYRIARTYGISPRDLMEVNDLSDPRQLQPGAELFIPGARRALDVPGLAPGGPAAPEPDEEDEVATATPGRPPAVPAPPTSTGTATAGAGGRPALRWPVKGVLYSRYGMRQGQRHDGIDVAAPEGSPVSAAADGQVVYAGAQPGYGQVVILRHPGGLLTLYAHMSKVLVADGARVKAGDAIARVGQSGRTTGPHLHFEVREGTRPRNPLLYLQ